jgi:hypothetical protein
MQAASVSSSNGSATAKAPMPTYGGHPDYDFAAALDKV